MHLHLGAAFQALSLLLQQRRDHLQAAVAVFQEAGVEAEAGADGNYAIRTKMLRFFILIIYLLLYQQFYQKLYHPKAQELALISYYR